MKVSAEVVKGICPTCDEDTMLVGLTNELYRCMNCGADLEQHVNGKITYLPIIASPPDKDDYAFCKRMERWLNKSFTHFLPREINLRKAGPVNT
jgi:DNA-directed RNA polymerase subunit RPC12/RpoP